MKYSAIIPCGGVGSRLNLGYNKILYEIDGEYLIEKTLKNFIIDEDCVEIIVVSHESNLETLMGIIKTPKVKFTIGGNNREESVYNGLKIASNEYVLIHDGARPNITNDLIQRIKDKLKTTDNVIPVVKCKDASLINNNYHYNEVLLIQTPQATKVNLLLNAMENVDLSKYKDDISIICDYYNVNPSLVEGDYNNIKVTTIEDLKYINK